MTCKRCKGYTCLMCGARVEDKPVQPLDLPYQGALKPIPPRKVVRRA